MARLAQRTPDIEGFMEWSLQQPIAPSAGMSAGDFLAKLRTVSFLDASAVARVADAIDNIADGVLPLAASPQRKLWVAPTTTDLTYDPYNSSKAAGWGDDEDGEGEGDDEPAFSVPQGERKDIHPWVAKLELAGPGTTAAAARGRPRFVYPVGRLLWQDVRPIDTIPQSERAGLDANVSKRPLQRTNYAVVIDVAGGAQKGVWLVYNRHPYDAEMGTYLIRGALPQDDVLVFPGTTSANPDIAQLFATLAQWTVGPNTTLPALDVVGVRVRDTMLEGEVIAQTATVDEARQAIATSGAPAAG